MGDILAVNPDLWFFRSIRLMCALVFLLIVTPSARGQDTWHNVYHSLKRFFTGGSSSTPTPSHRVRHSANHAKVKESTQPAAANPETSPEAGASPTPRVVILPAASPTAERDQATASPSATSDAGAAKPETSPKTPVLLSMPPATPGASPKVLPSPAPGTGNATSN